MRKRGLLGLSATHHRYDNRNGMLTIIEILIIEILIMKDFDNENSLNTFQVCVI